MTNKIHLKKNVVPIIQKGDNLINQLNLPWILGKIFNLLILMQVGNISLLSNTTERKATFLLSWKMTTMMMIMKIIKIPNTFLSSRKLSNADLLVRKMLITKIGYFIRRTKVNVKVWNNSLTIIYSTFNNENSLSVILNISNVVNLYIIRVLNFSQTQIC